MDTLSWKGFGWRLLFALILVIATYNPTTYSYFHWFKLDFPSVTAIKAVCGIVLIIGWVVYLRATLRSLGKIGLGLAGAFLAAFIWLLVDLGMLSLGSRSAVAWLVLLVLALVLAIGMSWSFIRRRLSGQLDTDDVDVG